jgi:hypothetical protein
MSETQQQDGAASASSPTGDEAQVGYAGVIRQRFIERAEFSNPKELAVAFHEAMTGAKLGEPTLPHQQQVARFQALSDVREVKAFTQAAGAEMARMYMVLDGLALRFGAQVSRVDLGASQGRAAAADLERAGKLVDMLLKVTKEARICLGASNLLAHDLRALGFGGEAGVGGSHSSE